MSQSNSFEINKSDSEELNTLIDLALQEDIRGGDITTNAIYSGSEVASADFIAKQDGILAGVEVAKLIFQKIEPSILFKPLLSDGARVKKGEIFAQVSGPAGALLTAERTVLNFMQRMSGISTKVHEFTSLISHTKAKVLDTRKTIPGHRFTDKWAVRIGGGQNHRIGLYDRYLIKENHIAVAGGITNAIEACISHRQKNNLNAEIEIEISDLSQLDEVLKFSEVDYVMLDNMPVEKMRNAVEIVSGRVKLEASGNVSISTIGKIAETGVDYISVGAITHSVEALDISLLFR